MDRHRGHRRIASVTSTLDTTLDAVAAPRAGSQQWSAMWSPGRSIFLARSSKEPGDFALDTVRCHRFHADAISLDPVILARRSKSVARVVPRVQYLLFLHRSARPAAKAVACTSCTACMKRRPRSAAAASTGSICPVSGQREYQVLPLPEAVACGAASV